MNIAVDNLQDVATPGQTFELPRPEELLLDLFLSLPPTERVIHFATTERAAEMIGVSRRTIQLWVELGLIQAVRVGKRYQVSLSSLRSYLAATLR